MIICAISRRELPNCHVYKCVHIYIVSYISRFILLVLSHLLSLRPYKLLLIDTFIDAVDAVIFSERELQYFMCESRT